MCIIHNRCPSFRRVNRLKPSVYRLQRTHYPQHFHLIKPQSQRRAVDTQQIAHVKPSYQRHKHLLPVHVQQHPVEALFQYLCAIIRHRTGGVGIYLRTAVLRHHESVFIIFIRHRERAFLQPVKQPFLRVAVVVERLMIVDMIACQVRKQCPIKIQSRYPFLCYRVRRYLHKRVLATRFYHLRQQPVQLQRIRCRVCRRNSFVFDIIDYRRKQSRLVPQCPRQFV